MESVLNMTNHLIDNLAVIYKMYVVGAISSKDEAKEIHAICRYIAVGQRARYLGHLSKTL